MSLELFGERQKLLSLLLVVQLLGLLPDESYPLAVLVRRRLE
jgi:hypothetical protein